ncbi:hypothetical protein A3218_05635 [Pseudomonas chlororaphis]|uniref:hypothetical protein n=1 Tax=Pseudomonas chlororaphis TaxID=587753 RepID=UPI000789D7A6|nr:hypothetical protein [Pseudomonas chlororaphis]AMS13802.1 hypothetical protein A3218_05635 [Pseudomonas chlororaphis]
MQRILFSTVVYATCLTGLLLLTGCLPKSYEFSMAADWRHDKKLQAAVTKLTAEEQMLFAAYTVRLEQGGPAELNASGMISVGEAIEMQRQWQAEHRVKNLPPPAPQTPLDDASPYGGLVNDMQTAAMPSVTSFSYSNEKSVESWNLSMSFKNNSSKTINGILGTIVIRNDRGTELKRSTLQVDATIQPGAVLNKTWQFDYNSKNPHDLTLRKTDETNLVFSWYPFTYRFADGTSLTLAK